jgi:DNA invertase Pin-like site-specific DNA recombinase
MATGKYVAYYRVSTARQGRSGLGLEAQQAAVASFLNGGSWVLLAEFTEVESGKRNDRPQLVAALDYCKRHKAVLCIAKLDRLSRNVAFISGLMEAGADFVAVDMPQANRLTLHVLAAVAEHEREMISARTKAALQAARARGTRLGWAIEARRTDQALASQRGCAAGRVRADRFAANVLPVVQAVQAVGVSTLAGVAAALNARGIKTARGGAWYAATVRNLLARSPAATAIKAQAWPSAIA